jgi:Spy/CpxP family protein refolding chaperone
MNPRFHDSILISAALFCLTVTPGLAQELAQTSIGGAALAKHQLPPAIADGAGGSPSQTSSQDDRLSCLPGHHLSKALSASGVDLTDAQVEKLTALREDLIKSMISPVGHLVALFIDAKEALTSSDLNDAKVHTIFASMKTEIDTSYSKCTDHILAVAHVFTSDQRQKMGTAVDRIGLGSLGMRHHQSSSSTQHESASPSAEKH